MKFRIWRASADFESETAPCAGAERGADGDWYIEVPDIAALLKLIEAVGEVVLNRSSIMIYDDYIE